MAGYKFGKNMFVNWYAAAVSLCHFFQSVIYIAAYMYPSEMASLIKVKFLNKVKGQFGQQINQDLPKWIIKQCGQCNIR